MKVSYLEKPRPALLPHLFLLGADLAQPDGLLPAPRGSGEAAQPARGDKGSGAEKE